MLGVRGEVALQQGGAVHEQELCISQLKEVGDTRDTDERQEERGESILFRERKCKEEERLRLQWWTRVGCKMG